MIVAFLIILGCWWLLLIRALSIQWSIYEAYHYAWAVPFLCIYLLWRRCGVVDIRVVGAGDVAHRRSSVFPPGASRAAPFTIGPRPPNGRAVALVLLLVVAVLWAPTRWLHEANPIWRLTSLAWSVECITLTLCGVYLVLGDSWVRRVWFPTAFFLFAVPWPSGLEHGVVQAMTRIISSTAVELLGALGIPALRHGNVIETALGGVGIDEACSGIRSLQATLMLAAFFGEFYSLTVRRRVLCIVAGCLVSFISNLGRNTLLAGLVAEKGPAALARWHDLGGTSVLVAAFAALWLLASSLSPGHRPATVRPAEPLGRAALRSGLWLPVGLAFWLALVELGTEFWYRSHEHTRSPSVSWGADPDPTIPGLERCEMRADILAQFSADQALEARWRDPSGITGQLYYFRWLPARSMKQRAEIQLAKMHGPEGCLPGLGMVLKSDNGIVTTRIQDRNLPLRHYVFAAGDRPIHVFFGIYEDSDGGQALALRRDDVWTRIAAAAAGSRNYGQRFLEIALFDIDEPVEARAILCDLLPRLLRVEP